MRTKVGKYTIAVSDAEFAVDKAKFVENQMKNLEIIKPDDDIKKALGEMHDAYTAKKQGVSEQVVEKNKKGQPVM